jgi:hypothetical protein
VFIPTKEACDLIITHPAPVLFLDTCIFLDIIRTPHREEISSNNILSAISITNLSGRNSPRFWLITNETVHGEFEANIANVKTELMRDIKKQEEKREKFIRCVNATLGQEFQHGHRLMQLQLDNHLENLSKKIMQESLKLRVEEMHSVKAMHRVRKCLAPARKGKQEAKDCEILEAFLDFSQQIRAEGINEKIFFITSNTDDYGKPENFLIKEEFAQVNAMYVSNLSWALHEVGIHGGE